eukprot:15277810-Alexandrium_andersonii.AAC.1
MSVRPDAISCNGEQPRVHVSGELRVSEYTESQAGDGMAAQPDLEETTSTLGQDDHLSDAL